MTERAFFPLADVRRRLNERCRDLFRQGWGEPTHPGATNWRAKSDSAKSMVVSGPDAGAWYDFKAGRGGYGLEFLATEILGLSDTNADFRALLIEAARFLGEPDPSRWEQTPHVFSGVRETERDGERAERILLAQTLHGAALPVSGTLGAEYLARRSITAWLDDLRFLPPLSQVPGLLWRHREFLHPQFASLVAFCRNASGEITGGQRILLDEAGIKAPVDQQKPAFGVLRGAAFQLSGTRHEGPLFLAEGPETALSIWQATGFDTWAVLGVAGFRNAPVPFDRRVIVCPDRDAPDSAAAKTLNEALRELHARGLDLWVAEAPEPDGSRADFNDTLRRDGADAVRAAIDAARPFKPRGRNGRFGGWASYETHPTDLPNFVTPETAAARIRKVVSDWRTAAAEWTEETPPPTVVVAASPGAGKSVITRRVLAEAGCADLHGDIVYYAPTLELAEEAAADFANLTGCDHVMRGRSAMNPATGETMCRRADLAEKVIAAGLRVKPTLCEVDTPDGGRELCPYHDDCAYLAQMASLGPDPVIRFTSSAYLRLPEDGTDRNIAARVIDEKVWPLFIKIIDVPLSTWVRQRRPNVKLAGDALEAAAIALEMTEAARFVATELRAGRSPVALNQSPEVLEEFVRYELKATTLTAGPSARDDRLVREVEAYASFDQGASERAEIWRLLAECKRQGRDSTERLRWVNVDGQDLMRVTRLGSLPTPKPTLLLDADADLDITDRLFPDAVIDRVALRPNAEVLQVCDRLFSMKSLKSADLRKDIAALIRIEAFRDKFNSNRGVLCIATRKIVLQFYSDAGHPVDDLSPDEANQYIRQTTLHGASWLWFGPASLGKNVWQSFGTAIVVGREELPAAVLQDMGRALFGDAGAPLNLIDEVDGQKLPLGEVCYSLTNGSGRATRVPRHPDPRVAALQIQRRELASRQAYERLRLVRATEPKRLILLSKLPIPGLPVDQLIEWDDLLPSRLDRAIAEAEATRPFLRLSAVGLAEDAPGTFPSVEAAKFWLRTAGRDAVKWGGTVFSSKYGATPFLRCDVKPSGRSGKPTPALIFSAAGADALIELYGPGTVVRIDEVQACPAAQPNSERGDPEGNEVLET